MFSGNAAERMQRLSLAFLAGFAALFAYEIARFRVSYLSPVITERMLSKGAVGKYLFSADPLHGSWGGERNTRLVGDISVSD